MIVLDWSRPRAEDGESLRSFQCTERPSKSADTGWRVVHPRIWEYEVQVAIHSLNPTVGLPHRLVLGRDDDGVAAVSHWEEIDGPGFVELQEMAVAIRHRRQGGAVARELWARTLDALTERAIDAGVDEVVIVAMVWHENDASLKMCAEHRLSQTGAGALGVQEWSAVLPVAEVIRERPRSDS